MKNPNAPQSLITLTELLIQRKQETPNQIAYYFLPDGLPKNALSLTYRMLDQLAGQVATGLQELGAKGERVLLCYEPSLEYIIGFFGCLYAGAIPVPAYPPDTHRPKRTMPRLKAIINNSKAKFVLTQEHLLESVEALLAIELDTPIQCVASEQLLYEHAPLINIHIPEPDDLAFIMYTSGSTGTPKGVMVSFENIWHNLSNFPGFRERPCTTIVSWLPLFHDLGLILGVLHPLAQGVPAVLMSPATFVSRPWNWLNAMSHYQATTTGGANFAYELCIQRIPPNMREQLDLSHWNMALNGAEPVQASTLNRFAQTFADCGFKSSTAYPSYGMAEATATVTGGHALTPPTIISIDRQSLSQNKMVLGATRQSNKETDTVELVGCGQTLPGQTIRIVDPNTLTVCAPYQIGEIWVSGPSIGQGYWQNPKETEATFKATLSSEPDKFFLRTGDLGFLYNDEIFLTGRLKDIIIINGVNHYPEDIENSIAQAHPAIRPGGGSAFAVDTDLQEGLVIVQEVNPQAMYDPEEVIETIRQTVAEFHNIETYQIVLIEPGTLLKTSSGKVRRKDSRNAFLQKQLSVLAQKEFAINTLDVAMPLNNSSQADINSKKIEEWISQYISQRQQIKLEDIDLEAPFSSYGMGSLASLTLINDLEVWLGSSLSLTLAWDYPNIRALAQHLSGQDNILEQEVGPIDHQEPIAIIGMSCRFPGNVHSPQDLWDLLVAGGDTVSEIPPHKWSIDEFFHPQRNTPGKMVTRWGSYIEDLDYFDADFFGISPREAAQLDPRQRLLLEGAWHALEDAGITTNELESSQTGVFIGVLQDDYRERVFDDFDIVNAYSGSGTAHAPVANRISYFLGLHGPSMVVDTACSGSLVAIHLACQSLSNGESNIALAGGVNIILEPDSDLFMSQAGIISADGRCRTFDKRANGIVRGEGMGILVLKPLAKAQADNDHIYAVIRGTAVNHDGRSNGLMAPSGIAQEALVRTALKRADLTPSDLQYIEAHGTGTELGDPIEVNALGNVLRTYQHEAPCKIGSIKTNIGHTEAAAGIAGVIKVILAMKHQQLPATIHYEEPNPKIPFDSLPIAVQDKLSDWPRPQDPLIAGISSFGFSGTNGHVILQRWEEKPIKRPSSLDSRPVLVPISSRTEEGLQSLAQAIDDKYEQLPEHITAYDIGYMAAMERNHFEHRLALVGHDLESLQKQWQAFLAGKAATSWHQGVKAIGQQNDQVVFVFSGQGTQWLQMGHSLYIFDPLFRATIDTCDQLVQEMTDWSLIQELFASPQQSRIDDTVIAQIAIFSIQVGLAVMWQSWGIKPDVIVGQSLGEIAAAHIAGALSLEDALQVVYHRAQLMKEVEGEGLTAVIGLPLDEAKLVITAFKSIISVAGSSSPDSSVISGDPEAVMHIVDSLNEDGIFARLVKGVNIAFHSSQMDPLVPRLVKAVKNITPHPTTVPLFSTVTGVLTDGSQLTAEYWGDNLRQPFVFTNVMEQLLNSGYTTYLEISAHPVLTGPMMQNAAKHDKEIQAYFSLRRNEDEWSNLLTNVAQLYTNGFDIKWGRIYSRRGQHFDWPKYAWQRERYWLDQINWTPLSAKLSRKQSQQHPLLGEHTKVSIYPFTHLWEMDMNKHTIPYFNDHQVQGMTIVAGATYVEMAMAAFKEAFGKPLNQIENLSFIQGLNLLEREMRRVQAVLKLGMPNEAIWTVNSSMQPEATAEWTEHITAMLYHNENISEPPEKIDLAVLRQLYTHHMLGQDHYQQMAQQGLSYGETFQPIKEIWHQPGQALSHIALHGSLEHQSNLYQLHPTILDACFQTVAATVATNPDTQMFLPVGFKQMRIYQPLPNRIWCSAQLQPAPDEYTRLANLQITDEEGHVLVTINGFQLQNMTKTAQNGQLQNWFYNLVWETSPQEYPPEKPVSHSPWLIFADETIAPSLIAQFKNHDIPHIIVYPSESYQVNEKAGVHFIRPQEEADYQQLLQHMNQNHSLQGIIYTWTNDDANLGMAGLRTAEQLLFFNKALVQQSWQPAPRLWLITQQAQPVELSAKQEIKPVMGTIWGMGRVFMVEHPEWQCTLVDMDTDPASLGGLFAELLHPTPETQLGWRSAIRYVARWQRQDLNQSPPVYQTTINQTSDEPFRLEIETPGMLETFQYQQQTRPPLDAHQVEVEVFHVGVNFKDVMLALGMLPPLADGSVPLGLEGCGRVVRVGSAVSRVAVGDDVVVGADFCLSRYVVTHETVVSLKPDNLSSAESATIMVAFGTAYYALNRLGQLRAGERVLIHTASGAVGHAAIQLAKLAGAEIFATAGTPEKRAYLRDKLQIKHVFSSRSVAFAEEIMAVTNGEGVDVVLNTLAGTALTKSVSLLRPYGRFLELGKRDIVLNHPLPMKPLEKNISYFVVDFNQMLRDRPEVVGELIDNDIRPLLLSGELTPIPYREFPLTEVEAAFRFMAQAKHIGKVVINLQEQPVAIQPTKKKQPLIKKEATYIITGGLGGLGRLFAQYLVTQGSRHLVLTSRRSKEQLSDDHLAFIESLEQRGAHVHLAQNDVADLESIQALVNYIQENMPPLQGIIHSAGVLADGLLMQMGVAELQRSVKPKILGAWNLHQATEQIPLDFFILFSSLAAVLPPQGQGNYAAGNAFMDSLAHYRRRQGLPAQTINWGAWAEVGMAARENLAQLHSSNGVQAIPPTEGIDAFQMAFTAQFPQLIIADINWQQIRELIPPNLEPPMLGSILQNEATLAKKQTIHSDNFVNTILLPADVAQRNELVAEKIQELAATTLHRDAQRIDIHRSLNTLGVDSIMAVELKTKIEKTFGSVNLSIAELLKGTAIADLATTVLNQLDLPTSEKDEDVLDILSELDDLSADELDALLDM